MALLLVASMSACAKSAPSVADQSAVGLYGVALERCGRAAVALDAGPEAGEESYHRCAAGVDRDFGRADGGR